MLNDIHVTRCRHDWPEDAGWIMNRPYGISECVFLHFLTPVQLKLHGELLSLPAGSCLFYAAGTPQWFTGEGDMRHNWMHLSGDVEGALRSLDLKTDTVYHPMHNQFITSLVKDIESELLMRQTHYETLSDAKLQCLLIELSRECNNGQMELSRETIEHFKDVRSLVYSDLKRNWTVPAMAREANFSPSYFHSMYKEIFKISPAEDLIRARLDAAKNLLEGTSVPISEIADSLGYSSAVHFCRQFKQKTGITPSEYRAQSTVIANKDRKKKSAYRKG